MSAKVTSSSKVGGHLVAKSPIRLSRLWKVIRAVVLVLSKAGEFGFHTVFACGRMEAMNFPRVSDAPRAASSRHHLSLKKGCRASENFRGSVVRKELTTVHLWDEV